MNGRGNFQPYWGHAGSGHPVLHILILVLVAVLVAAALYYLYRLATDRRHGTARLVPATGAGAAEALGIVRLRYARGEIGRDEFLGLSADLGAPVPAAATSEEPPAETADSTPDDSKA